MGEANLRLKAVSPPCRHGVEGRRSDLALLLKHGKKVSLRPSRGAHQAVLSALRFALGRVIFFLIGLIAASVPRFSFGVISLPPSSTGTKFALECCHAVLDERVF